MAEPAQNTDPMNWYCVHTRPFSEKNAALYLSDRLGLKVYLPKLRRTRVIRRVRRIVTTPLFPRYLFCQLDLSEHYNLVRYAPDVIDVVTFGDRPARVDERIIQELQSWAGEELDVITVCPSLRTGSVVEITEGPLRGLHAVVTADRLECDRVDILLSILDCGARMTINRDQVHLVA